MLFELFCGYTITPDGDGAETFGVRVYKTDKNSSGTRRCIYENCDITFNRSEMEKHIKLWNTIPPSLENLMDLIGDIVESNA